MSSTVEHHDVIICLPCKKKKKKKNVQSPTKVWLFLIWVSRVFHLYRAGRSSKAGKNWRIREKPPDHPKQNLALPHVTRARLEPNCHCVILNELNEVHENWNLPIKLN